MIASPLPERPWQKIGSVRSDLFHHNGKDYIIAVDYYSRFFEVAPLKNTTSENIVNHLKSFFCHHGIPEIVMSDNGLQFSVATFSKFVDEWGFTHSTSSPYYPQSKGEAERAIKTAKSLFLKSEYPYLALLFYRTTPLQNGHTPAELLMGRKLRSTLPLSPEKLKPMLLDVEQLRKNEQTYKRQQTQDYNKRHRSTCLSDLSPGETVWLPEMSSPAVVVSKSPEPRSYIVQTEKGTVRRNRRQVVPSPKEPVMRESQPTNESTSENISCPSSTSDNVVLLYRLIDSICEPI